LGAKSSIERETDACAGLPLHSTGVLGSMSANRLPFETTAERRRLASTGIEASKKGRSWQYTKDLLAQQRELPPVIPVVIRE
jgi:hypothetical protein